MKYIATVLCMVCAAAASAAMQVVVPQLPASECADAEVSTNIALNINAARLERLTLAVTLESCATNEVLVALGADADADVRSP